MVSMDISAWETTSSNLLLSSDERGTRMDVVDQAMQPGSPVWLFGNKMPLLSGLTIRENIALPAMYHGKEELLDVIERMQTAIQTLGLDPMLKKYPGELSTRDTLRVQVLRCVAAGIGIALMDSPRPREAGQVLSALETIGAPLRLWVVCSNRRREAFAALTLKHIPMDQD